MSWGVVLGAALWAQLATAGGPEPPVVAVPEAHSPIAPATSAAPSRLPKTLGMRDMLGPFASLAAYCSSLGLGHPSRRCIEAPNTWDLGEHRGPRGPFRSARLLKTSGRLGPHDIEVCRVAMQSSAGWFVSASDTPCQGQTRGATVSTTLDRFRWADEMGPGVLLVQASHDDEVSIEQPRWWGTLDVSFMDARTSKMLCGMGLDDVPRCSEPLVDGCSAADSRNDTIRIVDGKLEVGDNGAVANRCTGLAPPAGSYVVPLRGAEPGKRAWVPADGDSDVEGDTDQVTAIPLYGPFASIQQYCADLPDFGNWPDAYQPEDEGKAKPRRRAEGCAAGPGGWSGTLGARGAIGGVSLVRVRNDMAGATIHHCRVAMKTESGWFMTTDYETCQGVVGPDSSVDTRALPLRWMGTAERPVALVASVASRSYESYEPAGGGFDLDQLAAPPRSRVTRSYQGPRKRLVRACGVGRSGAPSCTRWRGVGCQRANGRPTHQISWNGTMLEAKEAGPMTEDEAAECSLERTSWTVTFP